MGNCKIIMDVDPVFQSASRLFSDDILSQVSPIYKYTNNGGQDDLSVILLSHPWSCDLRKPSQCVFLYITLSTILRHAFSKQEIHAINNVSLKSVKATAGWISSFIVSLFLSRFIAVSLSWPLPRGSFLLGNCHFDLRKTHAHTGATTGVCVRFQLKLTFRYGNG